MAEAKLDYVPLTKWANHFSYPSYGTMRNLVARRKDTGAEAFLSLVNGRIGDIHISISLMEAGAKARNSNTMRCFKPREILTLDTPYQTMVRLSWLCFEKLDETMKALQMLAEKEMAARNQSKGCKKL